MAFVVSALWTPPSLYIPPYQSAVFPSVSKRKAHIRQAHQLGKRCHVSPIFCGRPSDEQSIGPLETIRRLPANLARIFEDARLKRLAREADRMLDQEIAVMRRNGTRESYNGVFFLIFVNLAGFILSKLFGFAFVSRFALPHWRPAWYQFFTSLFLHSSWNHLSGNLFFLYIFGKLVEEEEGAFGLIASYLICGLGSNIISLLFCPGNIVSLGASGAVFGLFAVSVLLKMKFDLKKIIECLILGQFVFQQVMLEVQLSALGPLDGINHIAHVAGALVGVVLIQLVRKANRGTK